MASVCATIVLAIASPILLWKYKRTASDYGTYKSEIEGRQKFKQLLQEAPPGGIKRDTASGRMTSRIEGYDITYTVDPDIQIAAEQALFKENPYTGAIVAMDPTTGEVVAMASYAQKRREYYQTVPFSTMFDPTSRNSVFPMASIQKLITASAAFEKGIAKPSDTHNCSGFFSAGSGVLIPCSRGQGRGHGPITIAQAMASSCNVTFAWLAMLVKRDLLEDYYHQYLFDRDIDFDLPVTESTIMIAPGYPGLARSGCGLDGARVSPLHAAMVAAAIQNGGVMMKPFIIKSVSQAGKEIYTGKPEELARPIKPETAAKLAESMSSTVEEGGTGFKKFGRVLGDDNDTLKVMAKTGSLNDNSPQEHYTWFVGFSNGGARKFAFAAMMMTDEAHTEMHAASLAKDLFVSLVNAQKNTENDH